MAEFSGKIINAYYINPDQTNIRIDWSDDGKTLLPFYVEVDENNLNYKALVEEGWDEEKLQDSTAEYKRMHSEAHNIEVAAAAKQLIEQGLYQNYEKDAIHEQKMRMLSSDNDIFESILQNNVDKDYLFKFKLWALESDYMKDADAELKGKVRKAQSVVEALSLITN